MRKQIYLEIEERILSMQDSEIKYFGLWNEQTESVEQEIPFQCPAAFIEFMPAKWESKKNGIQETDLTIRLHIVTEYDTEQTPDFFDIADRVTLTMQNAPVLKTDRRWRRSQSITVHNLKYCIDNIEEYVCNLQEIPEPVAQLEQVTFKKEPVAVKPYEPKSPCDNDTKEEEPQPAETP